MYHVGWFSTGRDKAARDLLKTVVGNIRQGSIRAEIAFVFVSREPGEAPQSDLFINQVKAYQIPLVSFSYQKFRAKQTANQPDAFPEWRLEYDREVMKRLEGFQPNLCILAGYMLIVGREMCQKYDIINLHPAAPGGPAGTWQEVIWQLIDQKADETGVMMHLVTPELDKGPPVAYCTFPIRGEPFNKHRAEIEGRTAAEIKRQEGEANRLFQLIREHGASRELPLIVATTRAFAEGKVRITTDKKVVDAVGKPIYGYDLTAEINKVVK